MSKDKKRPPLAPQDWPTEYRLCVGVMVLNREGHVFTGRRIDRETEETWQMPQGGVDAGEDLVQAALRELREETSITQVTLLAEAPRWLQYDLPDHLMGVALKGKFRGQRQKWFAMRFTGQDSDIDLTAHEPEFDAWRWTPMSDLPDMIVAFKRQLYIDVVDAFRHLVPDRKSHS